MLRQLIDPCSPYVWSVPSATMSSSLAFPLHRREGYRCWPGKGYDVCASGEYWADLYNPTAVPLDEGSSVTVAFNTRREMGGLLRAEALSPNACRHVTWDRQHSYLASPEGIHHDGQPLILLKVARLASELRCNG